MIPTAPTEPRSNSAESSRRPSRRGKDGGLEHSESFHQGKASQRSLREPSKQESVGETLENMGDMYVRKIEFEIHKVEEMEQLVLESQQALAKLQLFVGGENVPADAVKSKSKQLKNLENRLDKALTKYNEAIVDNAKVKQKIQDLRLTKQQHIKIEDKLQIKIKVYRTKNPK
jgi:hypothetical protein